MSMWSEQQRTIFHKSAYSDIFWQWYLYHPARPTILLSCHQQLHTYMVTWYQMLEDAIVTEKLILVRCTFREIYNVRLIFKTDFNWLFRNLWRKSFYYVWRAEGKGHSVNVLLEWVVCMNEVKFEELLDVDQYNNNIGLLTIKLHLLEGIQPNNSFMLRFDYSLSFSNVFIFKVSTF